MRRVAITIIGIVLSTLCVAQTRIEAQAKSRECWAKYQPSLPAGAIVPKSDAIRINPTLFEPVSAYACVLVTVDENGHLIDSKVVETDHAPFGQHLLEQALRAEWQPATLDGRPFTAQAVVSAMYGS
jgi:hypothetical protein